MVRAYIGVERCRAYAHERKLTVQMLPELRTDLFGKNEKIMHKRLQMRRVCFLNLWREGVGAGVVVEIGCADGHGRC